ncbi:hypothetical protein Tco_0642974 [Tanacetum coccineum]
MGLWYPKDNGFELTAFLDSDHAGCLDSRKSTSGGIQFLGGDKLVNWQRSSKSGLHSLCSAEAGSYSPTRAIQSSIPGTKKHRCLMSFIKEQGEKGIVELFFVELKYQLADLFTKALSKR